MYSKFRKKKKNDLSLSGKDMSLMVDLRNKVDTKNQKVSSDDSSKTEQLGLKDI